MSDAHPELAAAAAKYAAVLTYNGSGGMSLAIAVKKFDATTAASDSGISTVRSQAEIVEVQRMMQAAHFTVQLTQYTTGSLLTHAQNDALALAGTL